MPSFFRYLLPLTSLALFSAQVDGWSATYSVTSNADTDTAGTLRHAINLVNTTPAASNTIDLSAINGQTITLTASLPPLNAGSNLISPLTSAGVANHVTIEGSNLYRAFTVQSGSLSLTNLTIQNAKALGGTGGSSSSGGAGGGAGMGAGGALFIAGGSASTGGTGTGAGATLTITSCSAAGGAGGAGSAGTSTPSSGGGGGCGGNGGVGAQGGGGGGGFAGVGGDGTNPGGGGGGGMFGAGGSSAGYGGAGGGGNNTSGATGAVGVGAGGTGGDSYLGGGGGTAGALGIGVAGGAGGDATAAGAGGGGGGSSTTLAGGNGGLGGNSSTTGAATGGGGGGGAASGLAPPSGQGGSGGNATEFGGGGGGAANGNPPGTPGNGSEMGGGGGASYTDNTSSPTAGGVGGYAGGGGGGGFSTLSTTGGVGGAGGFGAGGGGGGGAGAAGGASGGGGGSGGAGHPSGAGGGGGGGGAGYGGGIFLRAGSSLSMLDGTVFTTNTTVAGAGGTAPSPASNGSAGSADGNDLFLQGTNSGLASFNLNASMTVGNIGGFSSGNGIALTSSGGTGVLTLSNVSNSFIGPVTINSGTLAISSNTSLGNASNSIAIGTATLQFNAGVTSNRAISFLGTTPTATFNTLANTVTLSGAITEGVSPGTLQKTGTGMLTRSGTNSYTGGTIVSQGTLAFSSSALPTNGAVTINAGLLDLSDSGSANQIGALSGSSGGELRLGNLQFKTTSNSDTTFAGNITSTGDGLFVKAGTGKLTLTGANTYSGNTEIIAGTISLAASNTITQTSQVRLDPGSTIEFNNAANLMLATDVLIAGFGTATFNTIGAGKAIVAGIILFQGELFKTGPGTLRIGAGVDVGDDRITINQGTIEMTALSTVPIGTSLTINNSGVLALDASAVASFGDFSGGASSSVTLEDAARLTVGATANTTFAGSIAGDGSFTKTGTGKLTLTGINTYTGVTEIVGGTISIIDDNSLNDSAALVLDPGSTIEFNNAATLTLAPNVFITGSGTATFNTIGAGTVIVDNGVSFEGELFKTGPGTLNLVSEGINAGDVRTTIDQGTLKLTGVRAIPSGGSLTINNSGVLALDASAFVSFGDFSGGASSSVTLGNLANLVAGAAANTTFAGNMTGTGNTFTKQGTGTLFLTGTNNFTANTSIIEGGTLSIQNAAGLSATGLIISNDGTFQFDNGVTAFTFNRNFFLAAGGSHIFKANGTGAVTLSGAITFKGAFDKTGPGEIIITGASNSYTGGTIVEAGTLTIFGLGSLPSGGDVTVNAGTLDISGVTALSQTIGDLTGTGGTINLGASALLISQNEGDYAGVIQGTGNVTLQGTGTLTFSGTNPNTYSGITTVSLGELTLNKTAGVNALAGNIDIDGGTLTLGANNQFPTTSTVTLNTGIFNLAGHVSPIGNGGSGTFNYLGGTLTQGGGVLILGGSNAITMRNTMISGDVALTGGGTINFDATNNGVATIVGNLDLGAPGAPIIFDIQFGTSPVDMSVSGVISNTTNGMTKQNTGWLEFAGAASNTYTGLTTVSAGILAFNKTPSFQAVSGNVTVNTGGTLVLSAANQTPNTTVLTLGGGTLDVGGHSTTIGEWVFNSGTAILSGGTLTLADPTTALQMRNTTIPSPGAISISGGGSVHFDATSNGTATINTTIGLGGSTVSFNIENGTGSPDMVVGGVISNGALNKVGAGSLNLTAANTYAGGTTVTLGMLSLSGAGVLASTGAVTVNGGSFDISATSAQTIGNLGGTGGIVSLGTALLTTGTSGNSSYAGQITGTGSLIKQNSGTLGLQGTNNSQTWSTAINGGTLSVTSDSNVGTGSFDINNTGTLQITGSSFALAMTLTGTTAIDIPNSTTVSNNLGGSGSLNKTGAGTLTLSGNNTYGAGSGSTTITAGTLEVGSATAIPATTSLVVTSGGTFFLGSFNTTVGPFNSVGTVNVAANTLTFGTSATSSSSGLISGSGGFTNAGTGLFTLQAPAPFAGTFTNNIGANTQTEATSLPAMTINNGNLNLVHVIDGTYSGTVTGSGTVTTSGGALFNLHTTGTMTQSSVIIASGTTSINGVLNALVTVQAGAVLKGTGTITGDVTVDGKVEPGNSVGTLNIVGNYILNPGSIFDVDVEPTAASKVAVTGGTATIGSNVTLEVDLIPGIYPSGASYTVLTAPSVSGTFSSINVIPPRLQFTASYPGNAVILTLGVVPFSVTGLKGNAAKVGVCLDSVTPTPGSDFETVMAAINMASTLSALQFSVNQLQPALYNALSLAQETNSINVSALFALRTDVLNEICTFKTTEKQVCNFDPQAANITGLFPSSDLSAPACTEIKEAMAATPRFNVWLTPFGDFTNQGKLHHNQIGFETNTGGVVTGMDYRCPHNIFAGAGLAYTFTSVNWNESAGHGRINSFYGGLYSGWCNQRFFADASLLGAYNHYNAERNIKFTNTPTLPIDRTAKNHHNGAEMNAHLGGGVLFKYGILTLCPLAGLDYVYLYQASYKEHGAQSLDLRVRSKHADLLRSEVGARMSKTLMTGYGKVMPDLKVSWVYEARFQGKKTKANLEDMSCTFVVEGLNPSRSLFVPELGLTYFFPHPHVALGVRYKGEFGKQYRDQTVSLEGSFRF